jgi:hypothetical protein
MAGPGAVMFQTHGPILDEAAFAQLARRRSP